MPGINTVFGPIHPEQMGVTGIFEHICWGRPGWINDPISCKNLPYVFSRWQKELVRYRNMGGRTIIVQPGGELRHQLELFRVLSRASGINIVLSTGSGGSTGVLINKSADIDYLTELYITELTRGIGNTKVKAGALRVDCGTYITKMEEITLRSAVRAAKKTGCTLIVSGVEVATKLSDILNQENLETNRVVIGHCDDATSINLERDEELCRKGFKIAYDRIGTERTWSAMPWALSDFIRADMVSSLVSEGFINQVIVAAGTVAGQGNKGLGSNISVSASGSLLYFLGQLHRLRLTDTQINTLLIENPRRILSF